MLGLSSLEFRSEDGKPFEKGGIATGLLGYRIRGGTGRRTRWQSVKRFRRLTVPEPLEDRALPGGSLLELLLGAPLLSPFLDSSWADGGLTPSDDLPGPEARARNRTAAFHEFLANPHALEQTVAEVRNLVEIASTQAQVVDAQGDALPGSEGEGTGASAGDFPGLEPWWDDPGRLGELEAVLRELARAGSRWEFDSLGSPLLEQGVAGVGGPSVAQAGPGDPLTAGDFPGELPVEGDPGGGGGMATLDYGGGYGGNEPPVAGNDQAYCGIDGGVTIFVLGNDYDPDDDDFAVTGVSQPGHGSAAVGYGGGSVVYTPEPGYTSGNDSFQYTVTDEHGASSQAVVTVRRVEITGFSLERQLDDGSWTGVPDAEVSWSHDTLKWIAQYAPSETPGLSLATWWKKEWSAPDLPGNWSEFAGRVGQPVQGNPLMGDWAIRPELCFTPPGQTPFWVDLATPKHRVDAQIATVDWTSHQANPAQGGELAPDAASLRMYPDATAPGGAARTKVDVLLHVHPHLVPPHVASIEVQTRLYDVDDPDMDGPIDTDPAQQGTNSRDNFLAGGGIAPLPAFPASGSTDANGEIRLTLDVGAIQPGNNFRVAAGGHADEVDRVKALNRDTSARLFYDKDLNDVFNVGAGDVAMNEMASCRGVLATPQLIVWRKLHMEIDSMGAVVNNFVNNHSGTVYTRPDGKYAVPVTGVPLENNRFEHGSLYDGVSFFTIESNTPNELVVPYSVCPPRSDVDIVLRDDDSQVMPEMPDTTLMQQAYAAAFIAPIVDGGGNPDNNKTDVAFVPNVGPDNVDILAQVNAAHGLQSDGNRSPVFWIAYVQSAYQLDVDHDNDPVSEAARSGATPSVEPRKGSLACLETVRDVAAECGFASQQAFEGRIVAHEVAHQFNIVERQGPRPSMMHSEDLHDPNVPEGAEFNESQRLTLRTRGKSPGA